MKLYKSSISQRYFYGYKKDKIIIAKVVYRPKKSLYKDYKRISSWCADFITEVNINDIPTNIKLKILNNL